MELKVTRIDTTLPLPEYTTPGAAAFDVYARVETIVAPHALGFVPGNFIVHVPDGHVLLLASRSSTPRKKGLHMPHGMGVIDRDYCGPNDELLVQVWNPGDAPVVVARGERIAQAFVVPAPRLEIVEVPAGEGASRGGFGTTG